MKTAAGRPILVLAFLLLGWQRSAIAEGPEVPPQEPATQSGTVTPDEPVDAKAERQQRVLWLWSVMQRSPRDSEAYRQAETEHAALVRQQIAEGRREFMEQQEKLRKTAEAAQAKRLSAIMEMQRQQQLEEEKQAQQEARLRAKRAAKKAQESAKLEVALRPQCGEKPMPGAWDGSLRPVRHFVRENANDPDSISFVGCEEPEFTNRCWSAVCQYRGKNAFGATILKRSRFWMTSERVLGVQDLH